jgi:MFS family permease
MAMDSGTARVGRHRGPVTEPGPRYRWIALSNTTLGMLIATINSSIVLIALPDIFKGIGINPLEPTNTGYLLWMIMGFLVVTAVLVVSFGRLGDMYGRARMYNLGFAVFTVSSVLLAVTWFDGDAAALWLIGWRIVQGIGGAFLMANSSAILTDAFPLNQRGMALGINSVAAIAGSFLGLVIGGLLGPLNWHLVFLVSVPFGVFGTVWAYLKLHDTGRRHGTGMDWWGNITFAIGLIAVLVGITYGIQPYGGHVMGWTSPTVLGCLIGGVAVLLVFCLIERRVANPLFTLSLFGRRAFSFGNLANLLASLGRGGLQFVLIIWLQGIWLPQHGYGFEQTPLWAGIYMLPLTVGFLVSAPLSGVLSDRMGARWFTTGGMLLAALSFLLLEVLPVDFDYRAFAALLLLNGLGMGLFSSPNRADVMNSLPANARGAGAGMTATFQNAAMVLSIGFFFSLMIAGLSTNLPNVMGQGLLAHGVPAADADRIANLPPVGVLFAAFLGYNPIQELLGDVLHRLPADQASYLTGRSFFPQLISGPFADGLTAAFWFAIIASVIAAVASWLCGPGRRGSSEPVGAELAAVAAEAGTIPVEPVEPTPNGAGEISQVAAEAGTMPLQPVEPARNGAGEISGAVTTDTGGVVPRGSVTVISGDGLQLTRAELGARGGYVVGGLPPGTYTLIVTAVGFRSDAATVTVNGHGAVRDFTLHGQGKGFVPAGLGALHGSVSDPRGRALPGATVTARDAEGDVVATARTGADGEYELGGLGPGEYTVVTSMYEPAVVRVDLHAGAVEGVDLRLAAPVQESRR